MNSKEKLLFIKKFNSTFINNDIDLLKQNHDVTVIDYKGAGGLSFAWKLLTSIFIIPFYYLTHKKVFIWFADYHSLIPVFWARVMGVKSYLAIGGYDATAIPEINYGVFNKPTSAFAAKFSIVNANYVLPVAVTLIEKLQKRVGKVKGEMIFAPFGFSGDQWYCDTKKEDFILTVSLFYDNKRIRVKGLDFFAKLAEAMPEERFVLVGELHNGRELLPVLPPNLEIHPPADKKEIREWLSKAKVYAQLSITEGQPNAVCEAMLCECIPLVTEAGDMPVLVEGIFEHLTEQNLEKAVILAKRALSSDLSLGKQGREKIISNYKLGAREKLFETLLKSK